MQITELKPGDRIPSSSFILEPDRIKDYIGAVEESSGYFTRYSHGAEAPPVACVGIALGTLLKNIDLPSGTIHLSQEIRLNKPVRIGQRYHCHGSLIQNQLRGGLRIMGIQIEVSDDTGAGVLQGKTGFVLSEQRNGVSSNGS